MIFRNLVKKCLDLDESIEVKKLRCRIEWYKDQMRDTEIERDKWKGQANVDATECLYLKTKLQNIRKLLGRDDECFSKFSRDQIENMSIEGFVQNEELIDQDVIEGKIFLQS